MDEKSPPRGNLLDVDSEAVYIAARTPKLKSMARVVAKFEDAITHEEEVHGHGHGHGHTHSHGHGHNDKMSNSCQEYVNFMLSKAQGGVDSEKHYHTHLAQLRQVEQDKEDMLALARAQMQKQLEREAEERAAEARHAKKLAKGKVKKNEKGMKSDATFQPYSNPQEVLRIGEMFFSYDKDGTGHIEKKEFEEICKSQHVFLDARMFLAIDADGSGTITLGELFAVVVPNAPKSMIKEMVGFCEKAILAAREKLTNSRHRRLSLPEDQINELREMFRAYDQDHSGTLTIDELVGVMSADLSYIGEEELESMLRAADVDNDGSLSFDEFVEMLTGGRQGRPKSTSRRGESR